MRAGKEYKIQFAGLSVGQHDFEFEVGDSFFEDLEYSEIRKGSIHLDLKLLKQSTMLVLEFNLSGTVKVNCDRCGEEFDMPISGQYRLIVKLGGHETGTEDDDIITVSPTEHEIEFSQFLYEYIALSLPIKRVHPDNEDGESTCDPDAMKLLGDLLTEEKETEKESDPRWSQLKNIKLN